jgi:hypothetical protein
MATVILHSDRFPVGTSVGAYPQSQWQQWQLPPSGAPQGSAAATATVASDGTATINGLADNTRYFAGAQVAGVWTYIKFRTPPAATSTGGGSAVVNAGNLGSAYTLDCSGKPDILLVGTLTANCTITPTNMVAGQAITLELTQDATGSRTLAFSPTAKKPGGAALSLSTAAGSLDVVSAWSPDGTSLRAMAPTKGFA